MLERHYAPRATLELFGDAERGRAAARARAAAAEGGTVGALLLRPLDAPIRHPIMMPDVAGDYSRDLYAALHALDDAGCTLVLAERVPAGSAWDGVRDRLRRASTPSPDATTR
jgi:L-threonylcarbamoyladenylate synthase